MALVTLLLHPLFGGVLHALNWRRLGFPWKMRLALWTNLALGFILVLLVLLVPRWGGLRWPVSVFAAIYFYKSQATSFERHLAAGGGRRSVLPPVALMVAVTVLLAVGAAVAQYVLER